MANLLFCNSFIMIVKDIFEENRTEKSKLLKANLDKNHSVASHMFSDKDFLEQSEKKEPIAWPKMSDDDSWSQLDSAVYSVSTKRRNE